MISDRFVGAYIGKLKTAISNLKDDIAVTNFGTPDGPYHVGMLQGRVAGMEDSLRVLEETYAEQDV